MSSTPSSRIKTRSSSTIQAATTMLTRRDNLNNGEVRRKNIDPDQDIEFLLEKGEKQVNVQNDDEVPLVLTIKDKRALTLLVVLCECSHHHRIDDGCVLRLKISFRY